MRKSVIFNGHFGKLKMPTTAIFVVKNDDYIRYIIGTKYYENLPKITYFKRKKVNFKIFLYLLLLKTGKRKISNCTVLIELKFCIHVKQNHNFIVTWAFF